MPAPSLAFGRRNTPARRRTSLTAAQRRFTAFVLVPIIGLFVAIRAGPIVVNLFLSVTNYRILRRTWRFVGLDNFEAVFRDPSFFRGFVNSIQFAMLAVPGVLVISLVLALMINRTHRTQPLFQAVYFLPFILPAVATTTVWKWIYTPGALGIANSLLSVASLGPVGWLTHPQTALFATAGRMKGRK